MNEVLLKKYEAKVRAFYAKHTRLPSITELARACGLSSRSGAFDVAQRLIADGVLGKDRAGKLVPGKAWGRLRMLGHIRAGFAAPAEEELLDTLSLNDYLVPHPTASYLLKVEGDSMQDAGIQEGDMVVFERTKAWKPGDVVVALTEDGYTLKYLRKGRSGYYLEAANAAYPDIHPKEGEIIGVVVATFRTYR